MAFFPMATLLSVAVLSGVSWGMSPPVIGSHCQGGCPAGWMNFNDRCFRYVGRKEEWADAEAHCLTLGGNLASVHSEDEFQFLRSLYRAHDPRENPFWIGLTDCQKKGRLMWSDGSKVDFTRWNSHEPNNHGGRENCVHSNWSSQKGWNDIPCDYKCAFICALRSDAAGLL
ncbi:hypothetical protein JZ751_000937 [Albula glossodonta]|uniref:C-type lectin domain-containing protein n=1 Tax=Albula glossodonta TaxID=121402 RepID=A0A8T2PXP6_9TELE|nr:hypothetical protein JZ751_000937 [Albula glossodonta]